MFHWFPSRPFLAFTVLLGALLSPAMGQSRAAGAKGDKTPPQLRFVCISSLDPEQEVVLASRDAEGKWLEHATVALRSSLITDWLPATTGELHVALREENTLKSIGLFQYPAATRRALVVLNANAETTTYEATAIDPEQSGFVKGSVLIFNFSPLDALVLLGPKEEKVGAGQQLVAIPGLDDDGMYRLMASYMDADGKSVSCYDRQASGNPDSWKMFFLLPDKKLGLRASSLPLFGVIE